MSLPARLPIAPLSGPFDCTGDHALRLPGSKSITNRAFILAALADGESVLDGVLFSDDTRVMMKALGGLGFILKIDEPNRRVTVHGRGGRMPRSDVELFCGNSGTSIRFLTALCCMGEPGHRYALTGIPRMLERPIGELVDMLRQLGARIDYLGQEGFPPIMVHGGIDGGELTLKPTWSSQYITALLQIAPYLKQGLTIRFEGAITSRPYVAMTTHVMRDFGVVSQWDEHDITIHPGRYSRESYRIEPDASNASYFLAASAVVPGSQTTILDLNELSIQGDSGFAAVLQQMQGPTRLRGIDVDLNDMPDMAQTLAVVALFADGSSVIRNVGNLRIKETDRMAAIQNELTRFGATVNLDGDDIHITPPPADESKLPFSAGDEIVIETYDDHRMAMAFTVAGLASDRLPGRPRVVIDDPACVNKTFPDYFGYIDMLRTNAERLKGKAEA